MKDGNIVWKIFVFIFALAMLGLAVAAFTAQAAEAGQCKSSQAGQCSKTKLHCGNGWAFTEQTCDVMSGMQFAAKALCDTGDSSACSVCKCIERKWWGRCAAKWSRFKTPTF